MNIDSLKAQILKDTERLGVLEGKNGEKSEIIYNDGGEVSYKTVTTDTSEEIINLRAKIIQEKEQLKIMEANKVQNNEINKENFEELEKKQAIDKENEEEMKKYYFQQIKKKYKRVSLFERMKNQKPDFKKISNLTNDELNFLISLSNGETIYQNQRNDRKEDNYRSKGMSEADIRKRINDLNRDDFIRGLVDTEFLNNSIELEENNFGRHI